ncbi:MAG: SRPBCC family protein [Actinomycetota bacterium]
MISVESSVTIARRVEDVFAFVTDTTNDPQWHKDVIQATKISEGPIGRGTTFTVVVKFMGKKEGRWEIVEFEPNRKEVIKVTAKPLSPTLTYRFEQANGGTLFTRHIDLEPTGFFKIMKGMMRGMMEKRNAGFLANLKGVLER